MRVGRTVGPLGSALALVAGLALALAPAPARAAATGDQEVAINLYAFSQGDDGGMEFKEEGFIYGAMRVDLKLRASETVHFRFNASLARLRNNDVMAAPATIEKSKITAASAEILTLDGIIGVDIRPPGSGWTISPSGYYHHQDDFVSSGGDLALSRELAGGDTVLGVSYSFRIASPALNYWSGRWGGRDITVSNNLLLGWTQNLSPSWMMTLSAQLTRQAGWLAETYNFVALLDDFEQPVEFIDEVLPRLRQRGQLNARFRWTPRAGLVFGLDTSWYMDDWEVRQVAAEPLIEVPLSRTVRWRFWYRVARQTAAKYFVEAATTETEFRTQDSDLGDFILHSPGTLLTMPFGSEQVWVTRLGLYGFVRSDGLFGMGANLGVAVEW